MYIATVFDEDGKMFVQSDPCLYRTKAVKDAMRKAERARPGMFDTPLGACLKVCFDEGLSQDLGAEAYLKQLGDELDATDAPLVVDDNEVKG